MNPPARVTLLAAASPARAGLATTSLLAAARLAAAALPLLVLAALLLPAPLAAQLPPIQSSPDAPITIPRLTGEIELDGVVDESAWEAVPPFAMTMYAPHYLGQLTERTEIRIAHDDRFLYVSGRLYDSEPEQVRVGTFYRDQYSGDDLFGVIIDSYNDYETAVWFAVNPVGVRQDRTLSNDAEFTTGMPMNWDWNSHWDVATTRSDEGWFAEIRIPFSTLGFQAPGGEVTMGLIAYRILPRKNERHTFPALDPGWGRLGFAKPSRAQRVVLRERAAGPPRWYVTPYSRGRIPADARARANRPDATRLAEWRSERERDDGSRARHQVFADLQSGRWT